MNLVYNAGVAHVAAVDNFVDSVDNVDNFQIVDNFVDNLWISV